MNRASTIVLRLLPSLEDFAFLMPVIFLFTRMRGTRTILGDCDTGWHIRTGEWILANGRAPQQDLFSFTQSGKDWFAWEWLWDVIFAKLHAWGGLALVVLVSVALIAVTFTLLYRLTLRRSSPLVAVAVTMLAAAASSIHWLARPHLVTLLFAVIFYWILERAGEGSQRRLWWLPALTVLWTNLHGGFLVGIVLAGAFAAGELAGWLLAPAPAERLARFARARGYMLATFGCMAASFVNPYTWRLHQHIYLYLTDAYQNDHIVEFLSLSFHHPVAPFFEALLAAGVAAAIWCARRGEYRALFLIGVWAHGALLAARNIPIFGIVAAPLVAAAAEAGLRALPRLPLAPWLRRAALGYGRFARGMADMEKTPRWRLASVGGLAVVGLLLFAPAPPKTFRPEFDPAAYPAAALEKIQFAPNARIFTNDEWGDYLIYRLYPQHRVFVDGRSDFYGRAFEEKYLDVLHVKHDWESILSGFGIDTILLPTSASLAGALKESSRWRVVYDDGVTLVFRSGRMAAGGAHISNATGVGRGRDREITKTEVRDQGITDEKTDTTISE